MQIKKLNMFRKHTSAVQRIIELFRAEQKQNTGPGDLRIIIIIKKKIKYNLKKKSQPKKKRLARTYDSRFWNEASALNALSVENCN